MYLRIQYGKETEREQPLTDFGPTDNRFFLLICDSVKFCVPCALTTKCSWNGLI